jgi:hypothetical protein
MLKRYPKLIVPLIFLFPIAAMLVGTFKKDRTFAEYRLSSVRDGVTAKAVGELPVLIVRTGDTVTAYAAAVPPGHALVACGSDLVDPVAGRRFGADGVGLERVGTEIVNGVLRVYPARLTAVAGQKLFTPRLTGKWQDRALHPAPAACA